MDFTSLKNNPLYGPLRIVAVAVLAFAAAKGWLPATPLLDPDVLAAVGVSGFMVWSIWQQNHAAKKADLVAAVAVQRTVELQTPADTALRPAEQAAVVAGAKAIVQGLSAKAVTESLNASQLPK